MPKLSTPMMIGIGVVILIVAVILILKPWDDGEPPPPPPEDPELGIIDESDNGNVVSCSTFAGCPDDMEINVDANGESESECCQKKTCESNGFQCSTSACSSSEGCWDPIPDARGDSEEECCVKALCSEDKCNTGYKLRERHPDRPHEPNSGKTNSDCCEEKERCSLDICNVDGYESKSTTAPPKGDTLQECCNLKYCWTASDNDLSEDQTAEANGWNDDKCGNTTLGGGDGLEQVKNDGGAGIGHTIRGNTKELCCQPKTCHANGWRAGGGKESDCDDGYKPTDDVNVRGDDKGTCCVEKTCGENEWDNDQCRIHDPEKASAKSGNVVGNSVNECCESRLCSDYYFNGESCKTHKGGINDATQISTSSDCFTATNQYPGQEIDSDGNTVRITDRKLKENCAFYGRKLVSGSVKVPGTTNVEVKKNTCCIPKTCGEFEDMTVGGSGAPLKDICEGGSEFSPTSDIPLESDTSTGGEAPPQGEEALKAGCCSTLTCAEDYPLPADCKAEFDRQHHVDGTAPTHLGDLSVGTGFDSDNITIDLTKREQASNNLGCCKPVKCGVAFQGDADCVAIQTSAEANAGGLKKKLSAVDELVNGNGRNCCEAKKCSEVTFQCADWSERIEPGPEEDASQANCCQGKLCTALSPAWTNAKCKDKEYTRATVRGKLKPGARATRSHQEPNSAANAPNTGGDVACCEQDLKNNFARMCVGEETFNSNRTNYSSGVVLTEHQSHMSGSGDRISPNACRTKCVNSGDCQSFSLKGSDGGTAYTTEASPRCYMQEKFADGTDIPSKVGTEKHARPATLQYVTGGYFPEAHRYSGGKKKTTKPRLTAQGTNHLTRPDDGGSQLGGVYNYGAERCNGAQCTRNNATSLANRYKADFSKRKDILLAGVDKDFCPVDNVKAYGTWRLDGKYTDHGTWHAESHSPMLQAGTTGLFTSGGSGKANSDGAGRNKVGCSYLPVHNALEDCYRNLRCGANWVGHNSGGQNDLHSSKIAEMTLDNLTEDRRICPKGVHVKSNNVWPRGITTGGAFVHPTRIYDSTCRNRSEAEPGCNTGDTVRYGVMPAKAAKSKNAFWDGTLITGDSWNNLNVNTSH